MSKGGLQIREREKSEIAQGDHWSKVWGRKVSIGEEEFLGGVIAKRGSGNYI